jgi:hypothetical protein
MKPTDRKAARKRRRRRLWDRLKALLWRALAAPPCRLSGPLTVRCHDEDHEALLQVAPVGSGADPSGVSFPGLHFSPIESAVWLALADGPLLGKVIARKIGQEYSPKLRTLLHNLVERGDLCHARERGYSRAPRPGTAGDPDANGRPA